MLSLESSKGFQQRNALGHRGIAGRRILLGGCAAVERAAKNAGHDVKVSFTPGRTDASQEQTDEEAFAVLEPKADGFRNFSAHGPRCPAEHLLIDKATLLTLTAPEMTVLVGGLRVLNVNHRQSPLGVFTKRPGTLTNDFFVNLLDMGTTWKATSDAADTFEGRDRKTGDLKWTGSRVDLVFGSNSQLRAIAEVYACDDHSTSSSHDFVGRLENPESRSVSISRPTRSHEMKHRV